MNTDKKRSAPAIHIARQHQSAPKEHPADAEIRKAAEELHDGRWIPETGGEADLDNLGLALGMGTGGVARGEKPTLEDFQNTREMNELGRHPRVVEAIEKMQKEVETVGDQVELAEKQWMLYEMTALQVKKQKWDGQERWEGKENEAMRHGRILSPAMFTDRLFEIVGTERIVRGGNLVFENPGDKSGRVGLYVRNPEWKGAHPLGEYPQVKARELRELGMVELRSAKGYRRAGLNALADKSFNLAGDMAKAATEILLEVQQHEANNPEFYRVASLQWPASTEWMVMNFNEYGVPTTAKYLGWRTALLTMVRSGVITEAEAEEAFPVGSGPAAMWYLEQLCLYRNRHTEAMPA